MKKRLIEQAQQTLLIEANAINALVKRIDNDFARACEHILNITGRVIVIGIGKSGHIGNKIAATFASTGTPAFFVHPAEAIHGDLGMITAEDLVLMLSNSGETDEIIAILPMIKRIGTLIVSMTGNPQSTLAHQSTVHLNVSVEKEACPLNLAPTASTTAMLALGDALAVALLDARGFNTEDFARSHPGGKLGKRLLTYVSDIMRNDNLPVATADTTLLQAIMIMSSGGLGMIMAIHDGQIIGIFTDGDLRRFFEVENNQAPQLSKLRLGDYMQKNPLTINANTLAAEALQLMETHKVSALPVIDSDQLIGAVNMHDLLRAGIA